MNSVNFIGLCGLKLVDNKFFRVIGGFQTAGEFHQTVNQNDIQEVWTQGVKTGLRQNYNEIFQKGYEVQFDTNAAKHKKEGAVNGYRVGIAEGFRVSRTVLDRTVTSMQEQMPNRAVQNLLNLVREGVDTVLEPYGTITKGQALNGVRGHITINRLPDRTWVIVDGERIHYRRYYENPQESQANHFFQLEQQVEELAIPEDVRQNRQIDQTSQNSLLFKADLRLDPFLGEVPVLGKIVRITNAKISGLVEKNTNTFFEMSTGWNFDVGVTVDLTALNGGERREVFETTFESGLSGQTVRGTIFLNKPVTELGKHAQQFFRTQQDESQNLEKSVQSKKEELKSISSQRSHLSSLSSSGNMNSVECNKDIAHMVTDLTQVGARDSSDRSCQVVHIPEQTIESPKLISISTTVTICTVILFLSLPFLFKISGKKMEFHHPCTFSGDESWLHRPEDWFGLE